MITEGKWTNLHPPLFAVSVVSATDVWAGGDLGHLLHYTGGNWQDVDPPPLRYDIVGQLEMLSPTAGWALESVAYRYDGTTWEQHSPSTGYLNRISVLGLDDVWAIGYVCATSCVSDIAHWDGSGWSWLGLGLQDSTYLSDIDMVSSTEGWVVGDDYNSTTYVDTPVVLRYDGTSWHSVAPPVVEGYFNSVSATGPGDIWAAGYDITNNYLPTIWHYSGSSWTSYSTPDGMYASDISMVSPSEGYALAFENSILRWNGSSWQIDYTGRYVTDIDARDGQVWAVGGGETVLKRVGANDWTLQRGGPTGNDLFAVSTLSADDAWAVGADFGTGSTIIHYTGGGWQSVSHSLSGYLYDVEMVSQNEVYAVGESIIARWDGVAWSQVATPFGSLYGVAMTGSGEGWAVGSVGEIWHSSGGVWSRAGSPTTHYLRAVAMDSPSHGWAVGDGYISPTVVPVLLEYDGSNWVDRSNLVPAGINRLNDIVLDGNGNGWAVGSTSGAGTYSIMRLSNGVWNVDTSNAYFLSSIANEAQGEAWAIGCGAWHYVNGQWQAEPGPPTNWCQNGIALTPGRGGWVVGSYGTIAQYNPLAPGQRFYDVPPDSTFYSFIECMASLGIINGYQQDNTFRPANNVSRGQLSKIVSESAGFTDDPGPQRFEDVPPGSTFYDWINRLNIHGVIGGYACGGPGEPCVAPNNLPYFRTGSNATRGQIAKIVSEAAGFTDPAGAQLFEDVIPGSTFYDYAQRLAHRSVMSGYPCGGPTEPCGPGNLPYFRPNNNATRGQTAKIVTNTFFPGCSTK